jgi:hypothetical protein
MHSNIMSRTISLLIPAPMVATQAMTSRSWVSMAKAMRTTSPFQQEISKPSDAQRRFEAGATTAPSWARIGRLPVCGYSVSEARCMRRRTRFRLTGGSQEACLARFSRAATRR